MNQGIYGFPKGNDIVDICQFDASGSYSIPSETKSLKIVAIGSGGGGGGGRRSVSGTNAFGGGGGGGGSIVIQNYSLEELGLAVGATLLISVGSGGGGGAGAAVDSTSGSAGTAGGHTQVFIQGKPRFLIFAQRGNFGQGGTTTSGTGAVLVNRLINGILVATGGGGGNGSATAAGTSITLTTSYNNGGAGGGGKSTTPTGFAGGNIVSPALNTNVVVNPDVTRAANIVVGGSANTATPPMSSTYISLMVPSLKCSWGVGGAGGGGAASTSANNGGNGWRGSGGGGGGGALNGLSAGNGGNGGDGYVCIIATR